MAMSFVAFVFILCTLPQLIEAQEVANRCVNGQLVDAQGAPIPNSTCDADGTFTETPASPAAATLSNDGILGCLGQGARINNPGTTGAIGGVYVPVNDAAVTLNTGFLVYKECILDGVARRIAESGTSELGRQALTAFNQGRNGGAQFVRNEGEELLRQGNIIVVNSLGDANIGVMCPAFKTAVRGSSARARVQRTNQPNARFKCTLPTNANASFYEILAALREPQNSPYGAQLILDSQIQATLAYNEYNQRERWLRSNGVYDQMDNIDDPLGGHIITPGYLIAQSIGQIVGSGFRQLEGANEIDQVVSNLFGGLTTQLVADTHGLTGLSQSQNGQASYLDRMVAQTSANVRQQAANAALGVIGAARQIEASYRQSKEGIATGLEDSIRQLRGMEAQCWELIIPKVQERAGQGTQSCTTNGFGQQTCTTAPGNISLNIATSTEFSQQIIDSNIAPLATTTIRDIRASDSAIALLNQLISGVSNSASASNQQQALLRLDTMVANRQLHTATDANNAIKTKDDVVTALTKLVDDTRKAWGDSTDPNVGWCNVNNPDVITRWFNEWRQ